MRRKILLSSLTVGRCFKVVPPDAAPGTLSTEHGETVTQGVGMLAYDDAWKVTGPCDAGICAVSAAGTEGTFEEDTIVVEVPRQGYDRLVERHPG